jgi:hypothetical protein
MDMMPVPKPVAQFAASCGADVATWTRDRAGLSAFALKDGVVYHTYSAYSRGLDGLWGMYPWLDRAPKGRNESVLARVRKASCFRNQSWNLRLLHVRRGTDPLGPFRRLRASVRAIEFHSLCARNEAVSSRSSGI